MKRLKWTTGALLAVLALAACGTGEADEADEGLQAAAVERGDLRITAEATGTIEPVRKVEVKSKASGEILRLHVDVGDAIEPGALLAEVDPRDVRNRYDQAVADLEVAQARADIAQSQMERSQELHAAGVITDQEMESARLENSNAQANLIKARTNTDLAELQLSDVTIRAPMQGTVIQKSVEEGQVIQSASQNVSGGTTLFVMANLQAMQVRTLVDETDMGEIQPGMTANVTVEAFPDRQFRGLVQKIEPQAVVQQNVTMFPVIVTLDNQDGLLKPGMNAEVEILIDQATDVVLVPNNAIVLPQDAGPAAMALGLDLDQIDLTQFRRAGRFGGRDVGEAAAAQPNGGDGSPSAPAADQGDAAGGSVRSDNGGAAASSDGGGDRRARLDSLRARVARGEISQDSMRALVSGMRSAGGFRAGGGNGAAQPPVDRLVRNAVVFVLDAQGNASPKMVQIGLNDWDRTQVVSGLDEGDQVAVIGAAQLQAQQQEWLDRIRSRSGGSPFGGGGPRGR